MVCTRLSRPFLFYFREQVCSLRLACFFTVWHISFSRDHHPPRGSIAKTKCKEFIVLFLLLSSVSGCQGCGEAIGGGDPGEAAAIVSCESSPAPPDLNSPLPEDRIPATHAMQLIGSARWPLLRSRCAESNHWIVFSFQLNVKEVHGITFARSLAWVLGNNLNSSLAFARWRSTLEVIFAIWHKNQKGDLMEFSSGRRAS